MQRTVATAINQFGDEKGRHSQMVCGLEHSGSSDWTEGCAAIEVEGMSIP